MSEPLVSVLVPTYNGARFLRPALRSALEQSYRNLEIIVADDGSTDDTLQILAAAEATDPRVRVIRHQQNIGGFANSAFLFREARGEYVKYLLHDDVLATDCVRDLVRGLRATPGATLAFSRRALIGEDGRPVPGRQFPALADRPGPIDGCALGDQALRTCTNLIGELTTILFRREDVDPTWMWQIDGRRLDVLGDLSLSLRLLSRGSAFYSPVLLSRFRSHSGQSSFAPRLIARGVRDWPRLIDWGARNGFLSSEEQRRQALAHALGMAAARVGQLVDGPDCGTALEAAFLATAGLAELAGGQPADSDRTLAERAHRGPLLERFGQELDVWTKRFPYALAAPEVDAGDITATVQAFRSVLAVGAAETMLLAVPEQLVERAVPLVEAALAGGPDIDVQLVPSTDPATLLPEEWLAVARRDASWHRGTAAAIFAYDAVPGALPVR